MLITILMSNELMSIGRIFTVLMHMTKYQAVKEFHMLDHMGN